ncbi:CLUMA_CG007621, isoform A [Clunio marinus]|uniref:CLUMA_CG007621, isoform A n=1 Tax=Clunio marinus TaxID=568069 RepID=A0A1J1I2V7_9DIPT|nr:CLUMA_CG007621, isoform A [Clunio marinus]
MDSPSDSSINYKEENEMLKTHLKAYQELNKEVSNKAQEYKMQLNVANNTITNLTTELMNEKTRLVQLKTGIIKLNKLILTNHEEYMKQISQIAEMSNLVLELPNQPPKENNGLIFKPISRSNKPVNTDRTNLLNTICEESTSRFSSESLISSTPLNRNQHKELPKTVICNEFITPLRAAKSPIAPFVTSCTMASPSVLSNPAEDSINVSPNSSNQLELDKSLNSSAIDRIKQMKLTVDLFHIDINRSIREIYTAGLSSNITNTRHQTEDFGEASGEETTDENTNPVKKKKSPQVKKKPQKKQQKKPKKEKAEEPRRSTGRPKRQARLAIKSLAEASLNTKLRRD